MDKTNYFIKFFHNINNIKNARAKSKLDTLKRPNIRFLPNSITGNQHLNTTHHKIK